MVNVVHPCNRVNAHPSSLLLVASFISNPCAQAMHTWALHHLTSEFIMTVLTSFVAVMQVSTSCVHRESWMAGGVHQRVAPRQRGAIHGPGEDQAGGRDVFPEYLLAGSLFLIRVTCQGRVHAMAFLTPSAQLLQNLEMNPLINWYLHGKCCICVIR